MDINGKNKPNRIGKDVRSWNSLYGSVNMAAGGDTGYPVLKYNECRQLKDKLGIKECYKQSGVEKDYDYWGGAVKFCHDKGLHLPSEQTLAMVAGARYGRSDIGPYTLMMSEAYARTLHDNRGESCYTYFTKYNTFRITDYHSDIICIDNGNNTSMRLSDNTAGYSIPDGHFWSASELSASSAYVRTIYYFTSSWNSSLRNSQFRALCVGD